MSYTPYLTSSIGTGTTGPSVVILKASASATLTKNRVVTLSSGDADYTITLTGSPTLNDWFDQSVKTTASPSLAGLSLDFGTADNDLNITRVATHNGAIGLKTTGSGLRWKFGVNGNAESGGNAGSDFFIGRYADSTAFLGTALGIYRNTGVVQFGAYTAGAMSTDSTGIISATLGAGLQVLRTNAGATAVEWATVPGTGTVTNTGGNLTANSIVLGAGTVDTKVVAGITTDGTSKITLGVAGSSVGSIGFNNATSGTITLSPVTGALGTVTLSLPAVTATLAPSADVQVFTGSGNWTMSGGAKSVAVICIGAGGGGGGGSSASGATGKQVGGAGGGGGARVSMIFNAADLPTGAISVTVGATGGSGGSGGSQTGGSDGASGANTTFGTFVMAGGGGGGKGGVTGNSGGGGGGGGAAGVGTQGTTAAVQGGNPGAAAVANAIGGQGGQGNLSGGGNAEYGGAGGGGAFTGAGFNGGSSMYGAGGGGGGAGNPTGGASSSGGTGGKCNTYTTGGGASGGAASGGTGSAGSAGPTGFPCGAGGGGGGSANATGTTGGKGGAGGGAGGGGGGGGGGVSGTGGTGGAGASGQCIVVTYF